MCKQRYLGLMMTKKLSQLLAVQSSMSDSIFLCPIRESTCVKRDIHVKDSLHLRILYIYKEAVLGAMCLNCGGVTLINN